MPEAIAGSAEAVIVLLIVGIAVPDAIFQMSIVMVPASIVAAQDFIVHGLNHVRYFMLDVVSALPAASPKSMWIQPPPVQSAPEEVRQVQFPVVKSK